MEPGRVLIFGCSDSLKSSGLTADERAVKAQGMAYAAISTGSAVRNEEMIKEITATTSSIFQKQIEEHLSVKDVKAVKIGALFSADVVKGVSEVLQQYRQVPSIVDAEPFFKTGPAPEPELIAALREHILPSTALLSATVPEAKALLDEAGIEAEYPKNMEDVATMAKALRALGPRYVLIKREMFDEPSKRTMLHFVLCGDEEPLVIGSEFENPKGITGASYSIPPVTAANLAKGQNVPDAVSAAFKFVEDALKGGTHF